MITPPDLSKLKALFMERERLRKEAKQAGGDEAFLKFQRADDLFCGEAIRIAEGL